jgi:hypothetical protein
MAIIPKRGRRARVESQNPALEALSPSEITPYSPDRQLDIRSQQSAYAPTVQDVLPTDSLILGTFDARPIGGEDFIKITSAEFNLTEGSSSGGAFFNYTVPIGYRAILRKFRYELSVPLLGLDPGDIVGKLTNGGPAYSNPGVGTSPGTGGRNVLGFSDFEFGPVMADLQDTYVVADEGETIALILEWDSAGPVGIAMDPDLTFVLVEFYGNLIISTGRALNFEPGTNPNQLVTIGRDAITKADALKGGK